MIENPRRQLMLVLLVTVASLAFLVFGERTYGLDLQGGTQLVYEVDIEAAIARGDIDKNPSEQDIAGIMATTIQIIGERVDPYGTTEASVLKRGETGILVELPKMTQADAAAAERRISSLGQLEMRVLAENTYTKRGTKWDLAEEKKKLQDWLVTPDGDDANRKLVQDDPIKISLFNNRDPEDGGPAKDLRWYPRRITVQPDGTWDYSLSANPNFSDYNAVSAFDPGQESTPPPSSDAVLIEYVPINMNERHFEGRDLNPAGVAMGLDEAGRPAVNYLIKDSRSADYGEWTREYLQKYAAIILNGFVRSAPRFDGVIYTRGQIHGNFTEAEVQEMVKVLKTGSLQVRPILVSRLEIGATLGQQSIDLAKISIAVGGGLVLLFILAYYRLAGMVAFIGLALNIFLILGVITFIKATLTLPGLAGLVLTMGMAVDANILIYERIREELKKGKDLLQGVKTGFERAIVTILDANITTFLAGIVLYNVGVGPIRGFAVTLMVGIVTSVFTAFFVSRLLFHFLLERKILTDFKVATWFQNLKYNFLRYARIAVTGSVIAIVAGLAYFAVVPYGTKMGLDFTGGANLQVVLTEPMAATEVADRIAADEQYRQEFGDQTPTVGTAGASVVDGKSRNFTIKIKLTDEQRAKIDAEQQQANRDGELDYDPPYVRHLRRIFADELVAEAFSDPRVIPRPGGGGSTQYAELQLHFREPVNLEELQQHLGKSYLNVQVSHADATRAEDPVGKDLIVEYEVPTTMTADLLFPELNDKLTEIAKDDDAKREAFRLSDPIPEAEQIGGRMVTELRNAAIGALVIALFLIVMFIRVRFHEYKYGFAAVAALVHDVLITLGAVVAANALGLVEAELNLAMIAAFLTIIGYSINDTIVIFDRVRENVDEQRRLGENTAFTAILNRSINQTLSRTILTTCTTLFVVAVQFFVNYGTGTPLEGFSFALMVGLLSGTYSTIFIACPAVNWLRRHTKSGGGVEATTDETPAEEPVAVPTAT